MCFPCFIVLILPVPPLYTGDGFSAVHEHEQQTLSGVFAWNVWVPGGRLLLVLLRNSPLPLPLVLWGQGHSTATFLE